MPAFKIGTRGSPLALVQARIVQSELIRVHGMAEGDIEIVPIVTSGDKIQDKSLALAGGKGMFTKEIEDALISGVVDLAVHSMKDVPTLSQPELKITAVLEREDVRDGFISVKADRFENLAEGSVVGTASLRRQAQVKLLRPDLKTVSFRGNVDTRLRKLEQGVVDATLLASAGLNRLGSSDKITQILPEDQFLPAVGQGAVGIEVRKDNEGVQKLLAPINHEDTRTCIIAERAFLSVMDGSCRTPIAALARIEKDRLDLRAQILMPDGTKSFEHQGSDEAANARGLGERVGKELRGKAGEGFMADVESLSKTSL